MNKYKELEGVYSRPKMKFCFAITKILPISLLIAYEMKFNFVSGVAGVKRPLKNVNKPEPDI